MKKLISLLMAACMLLGFAVAAEAESKVSLDVVGGDKFNFTIKDTSGTVTNYKEKCEGDLSGLLLGFESSLDKFKLAAEYGLWSTDEFSPKENGVKTGTKETEDLIVSEVKGGYRVVDKNRFKLDLTMGVLNIIGKNTRKDMYGSLKIKKNIIGNMVGVDGTVNFSDKASLQGTVAYSLLGASVYETNNDSSLAEVKLKFNYAVTEHWGLGLGYRAYLFTGTDVDKSGGDTEKQKYDGSIGSFTLGATYKF
jgi:opacity protein-like surface antigen